MLIVLDNLEHLLEGADLILELWQRAPQVWMLATSRERLNLHAEQVHRLAGMTLPLEASEAVELFVNAARRTGHRLVLDHETVSVIARVCRLVEGLPLAIELAASWARALPLKEVAGEIERGIDILEASARDLPDRHRSVRAVFDHSWALLDNREKQVLRSLSVFHGGFRREAAAEVARATLPLLAGLVDKSLLRMSPGGRYDRHPLLDHYSKEKLAEHPQERAVAEARHGTYYHAFIREREADLWTLKRKQTLKAFETDLANVRAAWDWAVASRRVDEIEKTTLALPSFFEHRVQEGLDLVGNTAEHLDEADPRQRRALAQVLIHQSNRTGLPLEADDLQNALSSARRGVELLERAGAEPRALATGFLALGHNNWFLKKFDEAGTCYRRALTMAREHGLPNEITVALRGLAHIVRETRSFPEAWSFMQEALGEIQALKHMPGVAGMLLTSGSYLRVNRRFEKGRELLREAASLSRRLGHHLQTGYVLIELAWVALELGEHDQATACAEEAYALADRTGMLLVLLRSQAVFGRVAMARGDYSAAHELLLRSLRVVWAHRDKHMADEFLPHFAVLRAAQGNPGEAVALLTLACREQAAQKHVKDEAARLLAKLEGELTPGALAEAQARAETKELEEVVQELLGTFAGD